VVRGQGSQGKIRIQIPSRFWKVVVTVTDKKLQAFAFLLEQNLKGVKLEEEEDFEIPEMFEAKLVSLSHLEELLELKFPNAMHAADQHDANGGEELVRTSSIRHSERRPGERRKATRTTQAVRQTSDNFSAYRG